MRSRLQMLVGLVVVGAGVGLLTWGFVRAVQAEPAVAGSIGVAVIGALGVVWQQGRSEQARLRDVNRDRMTPIYYELLGTIFQKIGAGEEASASDPETEAFFKDLKARQLMLGASSEMVIAFNSWQQTTAELHKHGNVGAVFGMGNPSPCHPEGLGPSRLQLATRRTSTVIHHRLRRALSVRVEPQRSSTADNPDLGADEKVEDAQRPNLQWLDGREGR